MSDTKKNTPNGAQAQETKSTNERSKKPMKAQDKKKRTTGAQDKNVLIPVLTAHSTPVLQDGQIIYNVAVTRNDVEYTIKNKAQNTTTNRHKLMGYVLNIRQAQAQTKLDNLNDKTAKSDYTRTDEDERAEQELTALIEEYKKLTAIYKSRVEDLKKSHNLMELLAYHITGTQAPIDYEPISKAIKEYYSICRESVDTLSTGKAVKWTPEQVALVTPVKQAIKNAFDPYMSDDSKINVVTFYEDEEQRKRNGGRACVHDIIFSVCGGNGTDFIYNLKETKRDSKTVKVAKRELYTKLESIACVPFIERAKK